MKSILIIAKKEFHKSLKELEKLFVNRYTDYFQLTILIKILQNINIKYQFLTWSEFENSEELDCKLLVIPQKMFLSGSVPSSNKNWDKLAVLRNSGINFLFLHHPADDFIQKNYLDIKTIEYFSSPVLKYDTIYNKDDELLSNISDLVSSRKKATDEFTYLTKSNSKFITLIEKIPLKNLSGFPKKFICFGYQNYTNDSKAYFVDIHSVGSKSKINGILFEQVVHNIIRKIFKTSNIENDLVTEIVNSNLSETEKKALIDSRIGQGKFRQMLTQYWKGCSVTKVNSVELLKASHIKPWRDSNNKERLDQFNGFLLQPNIDILFDKGYITFDEKGKIMMSDRLSNQKFKKMGVNADMAIKLHKNHKNYLEYHRKIIFKA